MSEEAKTEETFEPVCMYKLDEKGESSINLGGKLGRVNYTGTVCHSKDELAAAKKAGMKPSIAACVKEAK